MKSLNEFELYISQLSQNSPNIINSKNENVIGTFTQNIFYNKNNPLEITISNGENTFNLKSDLKYHVQYTKRIKNTPFYISLICFENFQLKIIDYYDWRKQTKIFRLFLLKNTHFTNRKLNKLILFSDESIDYVSHETKKIKNTKIVLSENSKVHKNKISFNLSTKNYHDFFYLILDFGEKNELKFNNEIIIKNFCQLENICINNHLKNYFITKNLKEEAILDQLWTSQKLILPDLQTDSEIFDTHIIKNLHINWIKLFFQYFSLENKSAFKYAQSKSKKTLSNDLHNQLSDSILNFIVVEKDKNKVIERIQEWWNVYSLPIFNVKFCEKCLTQPEEIFIVYFNALKYGLPWSDIIIKRISSVLAENKITELHKFLLLLSHLYQRIYKEITDKNQLYYSPGYVWDNNYKSIKGDFAVTKFSKNAYTKLNINENEVFRIDKLCNIVFDNHKKNIKIFSLNQINTQPKFLDIRINGYYISLPLIWNSGFLEFVDFKIRWIFKKNRFQFTIHSKSLKTITINNEKIDLIPNNKKIFYVNIEKTKPSIEIKVFNGSGGKWISKKCKEQINLKMSCYTITKDGILSNRILFSAGKTKQNLFDNNLENQHYNIKINYKVDKIVFYAKNSLKELKVPFICDTYWDNFLHNNIAKNHDFSIIIHENFKTEIRTILQFFKNIFGFQPEFYFKKNKEYLNLKSNNQIYFEYCTNSETKPAIETARNKLLILTGDNIQNLLNIYSEKIKEYL